MKKVVMRPTTTVTTPSVTNNPCQPVKPVFGAFWKPKERRLPMICPAPSPQYQNENRGACSDLVYHWLLSSMRQGAIAASKMPRNMRHASRLR